MLKQKRNILLMYLFLLMLSAVSARSLTILERIKRGAGAGNCNGGRNTYQFFCYPPHGPAQWEANVQSCFDWLYTQSQPSSDGYGCATYTVGSCSCTVDSSYIAQWQNTFLQARANLYPECGGFTDHIIERYEGNMYLTATCN